MERIKYQQAMTFRIAEISKLTHDTNAFRFTLPEGAALDFLPGDHMIMHAIIDDQQQKRPYTPSSTPDDIGFFEMIIKEYPNGLMSKYIHSKKVGDEVHLEGPTKGGRFEEGMAAKIGMIAGGAGITPMISIIRTALRRRYQVEMYLLFANKTEKDIILRQEFEMYVANHKNFHCQFVLDNPPDGWRGASGFIDDEHIARYIPAPENDPLIFLCGPPMMEHKLRQKLLALGYDSKRIVIP